MSIPAPRRLLTRTAPVLLGGALLGGTLAACSAGQLAETAQETPDTAGVPGAVGSMVLDDVYLETSGSTATGGSATLRGNFTEESPDPDRLVGVTTPVATTVELLAPDGSPAPAGVTVPGDGAVDATTGPVLIRLTGLRGALSPQVVVPVTFEFATAGRVTIDDVPVRRSGAGGEPTSLRLPAVGAGGTPDALVTPAP